MTDWTRADWKRVAQIRLSRISELEKEKSELLEKLDEAEARIRIELEPRIEREEKMYDIDALEGFGDPCFKHGMAGNCGPDCEAYGDKEECKNGEE